MLMHKRLFFFISLVISPHFNIVYSMDLSLRDEFELTEPKQRTSTLDPEQAIYNLFPREFPQPFQAALDFLKNPQPYIDNKVVVNNSFLFSGPTGTGKSYMAEALSHEYQLPSLILPGTSFLDRYSGEAAKKVTRAFNIKDPQNRVVLLFIDEIDCVGTKWHQNKPPVYSTILSNLLVQIRKHSDNQKLLIIAATREKDSLDTQLTSKFELVKFQNPEKAARIIFFNTQLPESVPLDKKEILAKRLAQLTGNFSLRDLEGIIKSANAYKYIFHGKEFTLEEKDFLSFIEEVNKHKKDERWHNIKEYAESTLPYLDTALNCAKFIFNIWQYRQLHLDRIYGLPEHR